MSSRKQLGEKFPKESRATRIGVRRIIGIDPGLAATGWGVVEIVRQKVKYLDHGSIVTKAGLSRPERLFNIYREFSSILELYKPTEAAVEILYFSRNVSSALPVAEARGVLCMALAQRGIPIEEYSPNAIKRAVVGGGRADKKQIQEMIRLLLGLREIPKPDHAADALGAALCCAHTAKIDNK